MGARPAAQIEGFGARVAPVEPDAELGQQTRPAGAVQEGAGALGLGERQRGRRVAQHGDGWVGVEGGAQERRCLVTRRAPARRGGWLRAGRGGRRRAGRRGGVGGRELGQQEREDHVAERRRERQRGGADRNRLSGRSWRSDKAAATSHRERSRRSPRWWRRRPHPACTAHVRAAPPWREACQRRATPRSDCPSEQRRAARNSDRRKACRAAYLRFELCRRLLPRKNRNDAFRRRWRGR